MNKMYNAGIKLITGMAVIAGMYGTTLRANDNNSNYDNKKVEVLLNNIEDKVNLRARYLTAQLNLIEDVKNKPNIYSKRDKKKINDFVSSECRKVKHKSEYVNVIRQVLKTKEYIDDYTQELKGLYYIKGNDKLINKFKALESVINDYETMCESKTIKTNKSYGIFSKELVTLMLILKEKKIEKKLKKLGNFMVEKGYFTETKDEGLRVNCYVSLKNIGYAKNCTNNLNVNTFNKFLDVSEHLQNEKKLYSKLENDLMANNFYNRFNENPKSIKSTIDQLKKYDIYRRK